MQHTWQAGPQAWASMPPPLALGDQHACLGGLLQRSDGVLAASSAVHLLRSLHTLRFLWETWGGGQLVRGARRLETPCITLHSPHTRISLTAVGTALHSVAHVCS